MTSKRKGAPPLVEDAPLPIPTAPLVVGPYDPNPDVEGRNSGFTERLAEHLFELIGQKPGYTAPPFRTMAEATTPMEANGWRHLALDILRFMHERGFVGPGGRRPKHDGEWDYAWVYEVADWCIYDGQGRFVATAGEEEDIPIFLAAPQMVVAIRKVLARFEARGGISRSDVAALAEVVEGLPSITLAEAVVPISSPGDSPDAGT